MIPIGDIDLLEEIHLKKETGIVGRHHPERTRVRRVYSAKIDGQKSGMTVAVYQGKGAEEVCCILFSWYVIDFCRSGAGILQIIRQFGKFHAKPSLLTV
jgi:hypothetical protein